MAERGSKVGGNDKRQKQGSRQRRKAAAKSLATAEGKSNDVSRRALQIYDD